jgi:hypothetical protein
MFWNERDIERRSYGEELILDLVGDIIRELLESARLMSDTREESLERAREHDDLISRVSRYTRIVRAPSLREGKFLSNRME